MKVYVYREDPGDFAYTLDSWGLDLPDGYVCLGLLIDKGAMTPESEALRELIERDGTQFLTKAPSEYGCDAYRAF
ncbi:MAG: hypothetical protein ABL889_09460 [Terricaulis sp.]